MQKIEYKQNGFLIDNRFIAYQSIVSIKEPEFISQNIPDFHTTKFIPYCERYIIYFISVEIELNNQTSVYLKSDVIKLNIYEDTKFLFKNVLSKEISFRQYFYKIPNKNKEYLNFNENNLELNKIKDNIIQTREKLIATFNKWRIYYFN